MVNELGIRMLESVSYKIPKPVHTTVVAAGATVTHTLATVAGSFKAELGELIRNIDWNKCNNQEPLKDNPEKLHCYIPVLPAWIQVDNLVEDALAFWARYKLKIIKRKPSLEIIVYQYMSCARRKFAL